MFAGATFVKINYFLVAKVVSFDTLGLHLLTLCFSEPYTRPNI